MAWEQAKHGFRLNTSNAVYDSADIVLFLPSDRAEYEDLGLRCKQSLEGIGRFGSRGLKGEPVKFQVRYDLDPVSATQDSKTFRIGC